MAEQHTPMATVGLQTLLALFAARMGHEPRLVRRIPFLAAEAVVVVRNLREFVFVATLWTIPLDGLPHLGHIHTLIGVVSDFSVLLGSFLGCAVVRPALDASEMEEIETIPTGPDLHKDRTRSE